MKCDRVHERLDDLVDGLTTDHETAEIERHLASCRSCRRDLDGLRELKRQTGELVESIEPTRDLWPGIAGEIERRKVVRVRLDRPLRMAAITAAAAAIVVGAVVAGYLAGVRNSEVRVVRVEPTVAATSAAVSGNVFIGGREAFEHARAELLAALAVRRHSLSPATLQVVDANLEIIDDAIAEITAALEDEPESAELALRLASVYRQQIELLQRATRLPAEI